VSSRIYIRPPTQADQLAFVVAAKASVELHKPWTVAPSSPSQFRLYLERMSQPENAPFLVCRRDNDQVAGVINLTNAILGPIRSAFLGYYAFLGHEGQGLMYEGLQAVVRHAFRTMKLHRLEANIQPGNVRSIGLVSASGFSQEGYSPRYLKIGGQWRDHERWATIAS
jgi:[ribosomal protein S5]-alanine N-acetyltransferase